MAVLLILSITLSSNLNFEDEKVSITSTSDTISKIYPRVYFIANNQLLYVSYFPRSSHKKLGHDAKKIVS